MSYVEFIYSTKLKKNIYEKLQFNLYVYFVLCHDSW